VLKPIMLFQEVSGAVEDLRAEHPSCYTDPPSLE
jgi:hypothetical protein